MGSGASLTASRSEPGSPRPPSGRVIACDVPPRAAFPFATFRSGQREALDAAREAFDAGARVVVIEAPTGAGKSALGVTLARDARSAYVLTAQKILQDQYGRDYPELALLKGRATYGCGVGAANAAAGPCISGWSCHLRDACDYFVARDDALASPVALMNYAGFLHQVHDGGAFATRELLVLDEAHNAEAMLMGYLHVKIGDGELERAGIEERLPAFIDPEYAIEIAEDLLPRFSARRIELETSIARRETPTQGDLAKLQNLQWLSGQVRRLQWLVDSHGNGVEWVVELGRDDRGPSVSWKPVEVAPLADELLLGLGERVLMLSATVLDAPTFLRALGVDEDEAAVVRLPSTFPPERRPLVVRPTARLTRHHQERELPKLVAAVIGILEDHDAEKGLVHTHSYRIARSIMDALPGELRRRAITHYDAAGRQAALEDHLYRPAPTVLITPSMTEGLDLVDDLARFQVICKLPYPYLGDPQVAARRARDPHWYDWRTCLTLVQAYGRAVRSEDDHAVTYLLDADAPAFLRRQQERLPAWFLAAVRPG
jgi:ATP-dependent DNA helicase DinG